MAWRSTPDARRAPHGPLADAPRHDHEALAPPRLERGIGEHGVDDAGPERGRI